MVGQSNRALAIDVHQPEFFISTQIGDIGDACTERSLFAGEFFEYQVGKGVRHTPDILGLTNIASTGQELAVDNIKETRLDGQFITLNFIGPLDQGFTTEQSPLRKINLDAVKPDTLGIIEKSSGFNKPEKPGKIQIGIEDLVKLPGDLR